MACYHPINAWRSTLDERFRFSEPPVFTGSNEFLNTQIEKVTFPCGGCIGCRIDRAKEWSVRCVLEASLYDSNCFVTLTYDDKHLPKNGSLDYVHLTNFMKRLRKKYNNQRIRYYAVGEYGAQLKRPHFHLILFGFDFPDKRLWSYARGNYLYRSKSLESLWSNGYSTIGSVSLQSCAYVARYIQKKITGSADTKKEHYGSLIPEAARMSRRPGIASDWFKKYSSDVFPKDFIVVNGKKFKPSRFFDKIYKQDHPEEFLTVKLKRFERLMENVENNTPDRLAVREQCFETRIKKLVRGYENELETERI